MLNAKVSTTMNDHSEIISACGLSGDAVFAGDLDVFTPIDGAKIASVKMHKAAQMDAVTDNAKTAFKAWRNVPAPVRGEFVRLLGQELRDAKEELSQLVTLECGKIISEGRGEVQEMIDICDFAVGLSRQLYGLTIASERPGHHMREMWQPLYLCGCDYGL